MRVSMLLFAMWCLAAAAAKTQATHSSQQARRLAQAGRKNAVSQCKTPSTGNEKMDGLAQINCLRKDHGAPPLRWSTLLEDRAQKYADSCPTKHDDGGNKEFGKTLWGENMANGFESLMDAVNLFFYAEINFIDPNTGEVYDFNNPPGDLNFAAGHMTALLWRDSTEIGCGISRDPSCKSAPWYVCRFAPPGNYFLYRGPNNGPQTWQEVFKLNVHPLGTPVPDPVPFVSSLPAQTAPAPSPSPLPSPDMEPQSSPPPTSEPTPSPVPPPDESQTSSETSIDDLPELPSPAPAPSPADGPSLAADDKLRPCAAGLYLLPGSASTCGECPIGSVPNDLYSTCDCAVGNALDTSKTCSGAAHTCDNPEQDPVKGPADFSAQSVLDAAVAYGNSKYRQGLPQLVQDAGLIGRARSLVAGCTNAGAPANLYTVGAYGFGDWNAVFDWFDTNFPALKDTAYTKIGCASNSGAACCAGPWYVCVAST